MSRLCIPFLSFCESLAPGTKPRTINVNCFSPEDTLERIGRAVRRREGFALATINLDHIVKLSSDDEFLSAYTRHDVVVADGFPVVMLARWMGANVVRTTGADLVEPLLSLLEKEKKSVAMLGTTQPSLDRARDVIASRFPGLPVAFACSPPFGFDPLSDEALSLLRKVGESGASVCFLAFGAPKQEILAARGKDIAPHVIFVSVGAGIDFIAGHQTRAPLWAQKYNVEWLWRLAHDPRRLIGRYLQCVLVFPLLAARSLGKRHLLEKTTGKVE